MTRTSRFFALAVGLATSTQGCYTGLEAKRGLGEQNDDGGDVVDDGGGGPSRIPGSGEGPVADAPFDVPGSEVRLLPFHVRMANLATVVGVKTDHPMFSELYAKRFALGDHDYANGIAPDLHWSAERMESWVKGLRPVCDDPAFAIRYPDLLTNPTRLMRAAFARDPSTDELSAIADVTAGQPDAASKTRMTCLTVLTSLEFVAR